MVAVEAELTGAGCDATSGAVGSRHRTDRDAELPRGRLLGLVMWGNDVLIAPRRHPADARPVGS
ncbi:unannotated protein [freshwater metagenome]|uniref:Unannotated protein n=1 Tax=freshwater metagenome TaxID=449393 RepID=A0A6J7FTY5_9ZZZZ